MALLFEWLAVKILLIATDIDNAGSWGWDEYFAFFKGLLTDIRSQDGGVYVIADLSPRVPLPQETIGSLNRLAESDWPPENVALLVVIDPSPAAQLFMDALAAPYFPVESAASREGALRTVERYQSSGS